MKTGESYRHFWNQKRGNPNERCRIATGAPLAGHVSGVGQWHLLTITVRSGVTAYGARSLSLPNPSGGARMESETRDD
jgi:hypothetical protein